jgi:hypothetical protein
MVTEIKKAMHIKLTCTPKMIRNIKLEGTQGVGRPKLKWLDDKKEWMVVLRN